MSIQKVGFNVAEYALKNKMGIGSFRLKDGSSVKILQDQDKNLIQFFQLKNGELIGAKGYQGPSSNFQAANYLCDLEKNAENAEELEKAWANSCEFDVMA